MSAIARPSTLEVLDRLRKELRASRKTTTRAASRARRAPIAQAREALALQRAEAAAARAEAAKRARVARETARANATIAARMERELCALALTIQTGRPTSAPLKRPRVRSLPSETENWRTPRPRSVRA